jgi:hypothetical protein
MRGAPLQIVDDERPLATRASAHVTDDEIDDCPGAFRRERKMPVVFPDDADDRDLAADFLVSPLHHGVWSLSQGSTPPQSWMIGTPVLTSVQSTCLPT